MPLMWHLKMVVYTGHRSFLVWKEFCCSFKLRVLMTTGCLELYLGHFIPEV